MRHPSAPANRFGGARRQRSLVKYANVPRSTDHGYSVRMLTDEELEVLNQRIRFIRYGETPPPDSPAAERCRPKPKKWEE